MICLLRQLRVPLALVVAALPQTALAANRIESQSGIGNLQEVPQAILSVLFLFLPAVATFYLILTGYRYIVAQGNQELTEKAKKSLTYAVFGVVVAYGSALIILLFAKALDFQTGFGF